MLMTAGASAILVLFPQSVVGTVLVQGGLYLGCVHIAFHATDGVRKAQSAAFYSVSAILAATVAVLFLLE